MLVISHLADEGTVNLPDQQVVLQLMRKGFVGSREGLQLLNEPFRQFVGRAVPAGTVAA